MWPTLGQFGDFFGGVFTSLAFVGLIVTIYLQNNALRLTRQQVQEAEKAQNEQIELSVIATLANIHTMQRQIMEQGGMRRRLWVTDLKLRSNGIDPMKEARGSGTQKTNDSVYSEFFYPKGKDLEELEALVADLKDQELGELKALEAQQFRTSFEAWIDSRCNQNELLEELNQKRENGERVEAA